jgi:hypothetical protein
MSRRCVGALTLAGLEARPGTTAPRHSRTNAGRVDKLSTLRRKLCAVDNGAVVEPERASGATSPKLASNSTTAKDMAEQAQQQAASERGERPVSDAFSQFGEELADSLRREFRQVRDEASERARAGALGAAFLAGAAVTGAVATVAALSLPVLALRRLLGPGPTAVLIAVGAGGATAYLAKRGLDELGVPTEAATERVKDAARQAVNST